MEVVTLDSVSDDEGILGIQKTITHGLNRRRSKTLQRDINNVSVTGNDVGSDLAEIRNRVCSQIVMMITRILESSPSWEGGQTSHAPADSTVWTRM